MIDGKRIADRLKLLNRSQGWLARQIGVSPALISKIAAGGVNETSRLYQIARALETTPEYLSGETADPGETLSEPRRPWRPASAPGRPPAASADEAERDFAEHLGLVRIDEIEPGGAEMEPRWVPLDWLRHFSAASPRLLAVMRPKGAAMHPTIGEGDIVIIDRADTEIDRQDAIWALRYGRLATLKRVLVLPDGRYRLSGDNPQVRDETAEAGDMEIIGRVAGVTQRL